MIVATKNNHKLKEIKKILKGIKLPIISLVDLDRTFRIVENGKTFRENALKKAIPVSKIYKQDYLLGEDSGIMVDHLKGGPGVYSKRYAGPDGNQEKNNQKILKTLSGVSFKNRGASFICCLALAKAGKAIKVFKGSLEGKISLKPKGINGFGYDPVMYLPAYRKTVAELSLVQKNLISHRAQAFRQLKKYLASKNI